jgi:hypothetical protein
LDNPIDSFYLTLATFGFTLLGLWWLVLQTRHQDWAGKVDRQRENWVVSLCFFLPAASSLFSAVAPVEWVWRVAFGAAGAAGVLAVLGLALPLAAGTTAGLKRALHLLTLPLYGLMLADAVWPELGDGLLDLTSKQMEGAVVALLIILGVQIAWLQFSAPLDEGG